LTDFESISMSFRAYCYHIFINSSLW